MLVLGVMLIVASLDAVPDPPAIDPHGAMAKASSLAKCTGSLCDQPAAGTLQTRAQTQRITFTHEEEPNRPTDFMAEAGQATDLSPPV